jgi:hypothetical protein
MIPLPRDESRSTLLRALKLYFAIILNWGDPAEFLEHVSS